MTDAQKNLTKIPKKACHRGLEEYIVDQHYGDQQRSENGVMYMYLNNPVYRVGMEGDPAPNSVSSRKDSDSDFSVSSLHNVHPVIDSGSVFLSSVPWNKNWSYTRQDIPHLTASDEMIEEKRDRRLEFNEMVSSKGLYNFDVASRSRVIPDYERIDQSVDRELSGLHDHIDLDLKYDTSPNRKLNIVIDKHEIAMNGGTIKNYDIMPATVGKYSTFGSYNTNSVTGQSQNSQVSNVEGYEYSRVRVPLHPNLPNPTYDTIEMPPVYSKTDRNQPVRVKEPSNKTDDYKNMEHFQYSAASTTSHTRSKATYLGKTHNLETSNGGAPLIILAAVITGVGLMMISSGKSRNF